MAIRDIRTMDSGVLSNTKRITPDLLGFEVVAIPSMRCQDVLPIVEQFVPKKRNHPTPEEERQRFIDAARELEADLTPDQFAETVMKLAQAKPILNEDLKGKKRPKT